MRFLPVLVVFFIFLSANSFLVANNAFGGNKGVVGGPDMRLASLGKQSQLSLLEDTAPPEIKSGNYAFSYDPNDFLSAKSSAFSNTGNILGGTPREQNGTFTYSVQKGDTLELLSKTFGVSTGTIVWANASVRQGKALIPNQTLTILPTSGVLLQATASDSIESIAELYNVNPQEIEKVNNLAGVASDLNQGQKIIVPDGTPRKDLAMLVKSAEQVLPALKGYFVYPADKSSLNFGLLHSNNAVDIANVCGSPIFAAADGSVMKIGSPNEWNGGYGGFILIEHLNGTETLYAHTEENNVTLGDKVDQGEKIAKMGKSGNVTGPNGCHLHFEVHGAKNPFVK